MTRVAIVLHEPSVPAGLIASVIDYAGLDRSDVHAWTDDARWPQIEDVNALVVMGGTMNVDETAKYPFLGRSRSLMAEAIERRIPTLGVCLGSQMMARVLGAPVRRADPRNAFFSRLELTTEGERDPLVAPFGEVEVLQFHEDTFVVPDGAVALASSSASGLPQAFRFGDNAYAIQFHFEVDRPILEEWLRNIGRRTMLDDWGCSDADLLAAADRVLGAQAAAGRRLVERFLELVESGHLQEESGRVPNP